jgi:hypothetical protein
VNIAFHFGKIVARREQNILQPEHSKLVASLKRKIVLAQFPKIVEKALPIRIWLDTLGIVRLEHSLFDQMIPGH